MINLKKKTQKMTIVKDKKQLEPLYTVGGIVK